MSISGYLFDLQQAELEMEDKLCLIATIDLTLADNSRMNVLEKELGKISDELEGLKKCQQSLEWEMEELGSKIAHDNQALYGGKVNNPRELSGLQKDSETLKKRLTKLEEEMLTLMEQAEEKEASLAQAMLEFKLGKENRRLEEKELSFNRKELVTSTTQLGDKKKELEGLVEAKALAQYRELRQLKGKAVARVEQGVCRGCGILLSATDLKKIKGNLLVRCTSCSRILYTG